MIERRICSFDKPCGTVSAKILLMPGPIFTAFHDVFPFLSQKISASWILACYIYFTSGSGHLHHRMDIDDHVFKLCGLFKDTAYPSICLTTIPPIPHPFLTLLATVRQLFHVVVAQKMYKCHCQPPKYYHDSCGHKLARCEDCGDVFAPPKLE